MIKKIFVFYLVLLSNLYCQIDTILLNINSRFDSLEYVLNEIPIKDSVNIVNLNESSIDSLLSWGKVDTTGLFWNVINYKGSKQIFNKNPDFIVPDSTIGFSIGWYYGGIANKLKIYNVIASSTSDTNTDPMGTVDGILSGADKNRWASQPIPQYLIFDLGNEKRVEETKFAFAEWEPGRIYIYSISTSNDAINWKPLFTNILSDSTQWTIKKFNPIKARYIKLDFISANNTNWANLWEAEIYGE